MNLLICVKIKKMLQVIYICNLIAISLFVNRLKKCYGRLSNDKLYKSNIILYLYN